MTKKFFVILLFALMFFLTSCGNEKNEEIHNLTQPDIQQNNSDGDQQDSVESLPFELFIKYIECDRTVYKGLRKCSIHMWVRTNKEMTLGEVFLDYIDSDRHGVNIKVVTKEGNRYVLDFNGVLFSNDFPIPTGIPLSSYSYLGVGHDFGFSFKANYEETPDVIEISARGYKTQEIKIPDYVPGETYINPETPQILVKVENFSKSSNELNFVKLTDAIEIATEQPVGVFFEKEGPYYADVQIHLKNTDSINDFSFSLNTALIYHDGTLWKNDRWNDHCDAEYIIIRAGEELNRSICFSSSTRNQDDFNIPYFWIQPSDYTSSSFIIFGE